MESSENTAKQSGSQASLPVVYAIKQIHIIYGVLVILGAVFAAGYGGAFSFVNYVASHKDIADSQKITDLKLVPMKQSIDALTKSVDKLSEKVDSVYRFNLRQGANVEPGSYPLYGTVPVKSGSKNN